jgi:ankyrin repeat protein
MRALNHFQEQIQSTDKDDTIPMLAGAHLHIKKRIKGQKAGFRQLAEMVLLWITCARKPITAFELQHALAMEVNAPNFDVDLVPDLRDIILSCAGLVQVDEKSGIIRFVHDTIRIYFEQTREDWFPDGEMMMTRVCLTYLSLSVFDSGFCETDEELEGRLESYPLYGYAAQNWGHHARNTLPLCSEALNFLNCEPKVEASNQALVLKHDLKKPGYSQQVPRQVTGLHLAAYFGLQEAVIILLARYCSNLRDSHGRTPLLIAVENDQTTVIKLLLKKDADPELKDHHGRTPLSLAIEKGYEFSKGFLESEGNAGPQVIENWTPLPHTATTMRMFKGKPLSTSGGSNLDVRTSLDHTHPSYMVNGEDFNIIRLIHKTGANPDINATDGRAPLSYAAEHGRLDIVGLLLEKGADPNKKAIDGRTPLSYAAGHGRLDIVGLLLDKGADPNEKAIDGRTPLLYAAENGHFTIAKLLLEMGADPNTNALNNRSPLL